MARGSPLEAGVRRNNDASQIARSLSSLSMTYIWLNRAQDSIKSAFEALDLCRSNGDRAGEAAARNSLGCAYSFTGQHEKALENRLVAVDIARGRGDKVALVIYLRGLAEDYVMTKQNKEWLRTLEEVLLPVPRDSLETE